VAASSQLSNNYSHINYRYIMGDQRMMSFGFSGSPPPFLANKI